MKKHGVITGAGTGVGRAVAIALAKEGWKLALIGRTKETLNESATAAGLSDDDHLCLAASVSDWDAVNETAKQVHERFGPIDLLVNSAGTNTPKRQLFEVSQEDYDKIVNINLNGTYYTIQAFLPPMRQRKFGTIVNIVSDAAIWGVPLAGAAYTISKFGQRGLTQAINAEDGKNGIRACAILPGEIETPLLKLRPTAPPAESYASMLQPEDVAACVMLAVNLPARAVVQELLVRPRR
ncbi:MAG: putative oxidoreductase [Verrucomicrobia subdivision 3 bacterium]|nr:putative oxidoreductase [Limisphaerales bacterium]MCS1417322.1 putative oxidoreductase [Limisphaerales bacterium]